MPKLIDLTGKQFGHLTVIKRAPTRYTSGGIPRTMWHCRCDCGKTTDVAAKYLLSGKVKSCGHAQAERASGTKLNQLSDRAPATNRSGYRNISIIYRNAVKYYRVGVQYRGKKHDHIYRSLHKALEVREKLRKKYWPNYQQ